jgi:ubiquinone/menaquinone biosynthesis C-methylase UbiE
MAPDTFKDHFSQVASGYARYRPGYPRALFDTLAALAPGRALAWDCGTGNGQAAVELAERFSHVVATDLSRDQLALAQPHPKVEYLLASAEESGLTAASVDLVTVAQAVHWFDFERFYAEVERVLVPRGVVAVWTYHRAIADPEIQALTERFRHRVEGDWPPERRWVEEQYRTIPFPFAEIAVDPIVHEERWELERVLGYLSTWSAVSQYRRRTGHDPVADLRPELAAVWGDPGRPRRLRWPIHLRVGRA